ncbi:hypothetical protein H310_14321 [Aphanomyces invadans]|uniref:RING-type E3 ubiquitin transferase n=1 Tax=Aphanomyces invadans TaxID=157072 RepID=A0A024TAH0_9STRA|nr:hypothetical protein H310_14321 [Aphanomyces invadans]ETV90984.1 hypothetical protein H310_14321 [Aphanomyces invadans]|eukprot:XP_008880373.1 hypothetical protein H310_14321 [Aphanomyces invadans]
MAAPTVDNGFTKEEYDRHVRQLVHRRMNPNSLYDEVTLIDGLTLYDIFRQPRRQATAALTISPTLVHAEMQCPICLGIIRDAVVIKTCLHRFCDKCLKECLRSGIKECPSCRAPIGPKRSSIGRDVSFDQLIAAVYPDLERYEAAEDERIATAITPKRLQQDDNVPSPSGKRAKGTARVGAPESTTRPVLVVVLRRHPSAASSTTLPREISWHTHPDATVRQGQTYIATQCHLRYVVLCREDGSAHDPSASLQRLADGTYLPPLFFMQQLL